MSEQPVFDLAALEAAEKRLRGDGRFVLGCGGAVVRDTATDPKLSPVSGRERIRYNVAFARDFWRSNLHGGFW